MEPLDLGAIKVYCEEWTADDWFAMKAHADLPRAIAVIEALVGALQNVEWNTPGQSAARCLWCSGWLPNHREECERQAALALVRRES